MIESQRFLAEYVQTGSDAAFRELITHYVGLVYSTACRLVDGDTHRAEDVAQIVFVDLARTARTLSGDFQLGGWLHRHTCFVAAKTMRGERRRQSRERQAVEMNALQNDAGADYSRVAPILDEAINELGEEDRTAILLRFFEQHDFRSVGQALGGNEDAARMRVNRALDKLQRLIKRRGVTTSAATLSLVLSANAVQAVPVGLTLTISTAATLAGTAIATTATATALKTIAMTTLQKTLVATILVASIATPLVLYKNSDTRQRAANESLQQQADEVAKQQAEKDRLSVLASPADNSQGRSNDLLRLRAEAESLRKQTNALPRARAENRRLQAAADLPEVEPSEAEKTEMNVKMTDTKNWAIASFLYSRKNQGQFPPNLDQAATFHPDKTKAKTDSTADQFEFVYQGSLTAIKKPQSVIVVRQKEPSPYGNRWAKVYGYGDGHVEMHVQAENNFDSWEAQHIAAIAPRSP